MIAELASPEQSSRARVETIRDGLNGCPDHRWTWRSVARSRIDELDARAALFGLEPWETTELAELKQMVEGK